MWRGGYVGQWSCSPIGCGPTGGSGCTTAEASCCRCCCHCSSGSSCRAPTSIIKALIRRVLLLLLLLSPPSSPASCGKSHCLLACIAVFCWLFAHSLIFRGDENDDDDDEERRSGEKSCLIADECPGLVMVRDAQMRRDAQILVSGIRTETDTGVEYHTRIQKTCADTTTPIPAVYACM